MSRRMIKIIKYVVAGLLLAYSVVHLSVYFFIFYIRVRDLGLVEETIEHFFYYTWFGFLTLFIGVFIWRK